MMYAAKGKCAAAIARDRLELVNRTQVLKYVIGALKIDLED